MSSGLCDADAKALPFQPGFSCGNTDSLPCWRARLIATCHRHVTRSRLSNPPSPTTKKPDLSVWSFILPIQTIALLPRIRFSAEKPRPGKQSTGLFAWTGLSNPSSSTKQKTRPFGLVFYSPHSGDCFVTTDSLFCGKATAGQIVHRTVCLDRPFESVSKAEKRHTGRCVSFLVGEDGFEPSKRYAADLQSVPFGHSGTPPYSMILLSDGAGRRTRTPDLLITNQLLYQLSYTGGSNRTRLL